ncbi:MAG: polysaccharide biosynthesis/export family protein [Rubripirellula sp.]
MLITNPNSIGRILALVFVFASTTSLVRADEQDELVPDAPKAAFADPNIDLETESSEDAEEGEASEKPRFTVFPAYGFHPTDANFDETKSRISQVSHPIVTEDCNCGKCLTCVDRDGEGLIGGFGMKHGIGPCGKKDCQCWQCPYNAPFSEYGAGEYAGPARTHRVPEYRLRTGDTIQLMFLLTGLKSEGAYRLVVGDELLIESEADEELTRGSLEKGLVIQPDGTITLRLIGQVHAAGQTVDQLREVLEERYEEFYPEPAIDVTPVNTGTAARQVREAISGAGGFDPQQIAQTITPSGEIRLPRVGSVQAQGLTLSELKQEINIRYDETVGGLEVEPSLQTQAPHNIFVLGEVTQPGRFNLGNTPTTVLGAIAMAGGHVPGANLRQVVVFRRGDNWELLSTLLDLRGAILGREAHPADEIWIRDGDVIILPSTPIRLFDNFVRQVFTEGIYGVVPVSGSYNFGNNFNNN